MKQPPAPRASDSEQLQPRIPNYRLLKRIGKGGMGEVWLAENIGRGILQAVKFVVRRTVDDAPKFGREVEGVRLFEPLSRQHDVFVDIHEVGLLPNGEGFYYVMQLADNANGQHHTSENAESSLSNNATFVRAAPLNEHEIAAYSPRTLLSELQCRGQLPPAQVLEIGIRLAHALAILHEVKPRPLIHRDVKPANILFVQSKAKLGDPGLVVWEKDAPSCLATAGFTPHEGPGKPEADVYSLGMTLYCALTGYPPERFPELPPNSLPAEQRIPWQRLNSIICRACDLSPTNRYRNGREMLDDLLRVRAGRRPAVCPRVRNAVKKAVVVGGLVLVTVALTIYFGVNRKEATTVRQDRREIRTVFEDEFSGAEIDRKLWQWGALSQCPENDAGRLSPQPFMWNNSLMLETTADSVRGKECWQCIWLDSLVDLKSNPETVVQIKCGARSTNSCVQILIGPCDGPVGKACGAEIELWSATGSMNQPLDLPRINVQIDLSTNSGLAAVWVASDAEPDIGKSELKLVDLSKAKSWKLRFVAQAVAAADMVSDTTRLWLYSVRAVEVKRAPQITGWVTNLNARLPVGGIRLVNHDSGAETTANDDGMFVLRAKPGLNELGVIAPDYRPLSNLVVTVPPDKSVRMDIPVEKLVLEYGDVTETRWMIPEPSQHIAIGEKYLFYHGANHTINRMSLETLEVECLTRLPNVGMAWANGCLCAVETHINSFLYRVDGNGVVTIGPKLLTKWPTGLAFDGTNFWYIEFTNVHGSRCGLYSMSPSGEHCAHFTSGVSDLRAVAAGDGRLWVLAPARMAYELSIPPGVTSGQLDKYIIREFRTKAMCIVYAMHRLWLLGMDGKSIQSVWLGD